MFPLRLPFTDAAKMFRFLFLQALAFNGYKENISPLKFQLASILAHLEGILLCCFFCRYTYHLAKSLVNYEIECEMSISKVLTRIFIYEEIFPINFLKYMSFCLEVNNHCYYNVVLRRNKWYSSGYSYL